MQKINLPGSIASYKPDENVTFIQFECVTCNIRGPMSEKADAPAWDAYHAARTDHKTFWLYTLNRTKSHID